MIGKRIGDKINEYMIEPQNAVMSYWLRER